MLQCWTEMTVKWPWRLWDPKQNLSQYVELDTSKIETKWTSAFVWLPRIWPEIWAASNSKHTVRLIKDLHFDVSVLTDLSGLRCLLHRFERVSLMSLTVPTDQTHQILIRLTKQLESLLMIWTHQLLWFLKHSHSCSTSLYIPVPEGLLLAQMFPHGSHHIPQHSVGPEVPHGIGSPAFRTLFQAAALGMIADTLSAERVVAKQAHWICEVPQTHRTLDLFRQPRIHHNYLFETRRLTKCCLCPLNVPNTHWHGGLDMKCCPSSCGDKCQHMCRGRSVFGRSSSALTWLTHVCPSVLNKGSHMTPCTDELPSISRITALKHI